MSPPCARHVDVPQRVLLLHEMRRLAELMETNPLGRRQL